MSRRSANTDIMPPAAEHSATPPHAPVPPSGGFSYQVIRSRRRSLAIEIRPDHSVLVRLPLYVGDAEAHRFVEKYRDRIQQRLHSMPPAPAALTPAQEGAMRELAKQQLPPLVQHWAAQLGVTPKGITITSARTRFGSCSAKGRLCFSWRLMGYPKEAIDYVVLHEVAHLQHLHHGKAFYDLLDRHMPDHRARRALLRAQPVYPAVP